MDARDVRRRKEISDLEIELGKETYILKAIIATDYDRHSLERQEKKINMMEEELDMLKKPVFRPNA